MKIDWVTLICVSGFIVFDIITGIIKALYQGGIDSTKLRMGLYHKLSEVITVIGCGLLEYGTNYIDLGFNVPVLKVTSVYICIMELISIIENICEVNEPLRKLFMPYLSKLRELNEKGEQEEE